MSSEIAAPPRRAWEEPTLTRHTFGRDRCFAGVGYPDLIASIVDAALERTR